MDQRKGRQRAAIREAFETSGRPLSPLIDAAQGAAEGLGIGTAYRNIKDLLNGGWLSAVALPGGITLHGRSGNAHRHHFHGDRCSRVFELNGCLPKINPLAGRRLSVRRHQLVLYGTCEDCSTKTIPR